MLFFAFVRVISWIVTPVQKTNGSTKSHEKKERHKHELQRERLGLTVSLCDSYFANSSLNCVSHYCKLKLELSRPGSRVESVPKLSLFGVHSEQHNLRRYTEARRQDAGTDSGGNEKMVTTLKHVPGGVALTKVRGLYRSTNDWQINLAAVRVTGQQ